MHMALHFEFFCWFAVANTGNSSIVLPVTRSRDEKLARMTIIFVRKPLFYTPKSVLGDRNVKNQAKLKRAPKKKNSKEKRANSICDQGSY